MMKKSKKSNNFSHPALVIVLSLAIYLGVGWFFVARFYTDQPIGRSLFGFGQNFRGTKYQDSLDLKIAKKAVFPSDPIIKTTNLGVIKTTNRYIINFKVKADNLKEFGLMSLPRTAKPTNGYPVIILLHAYFDPDDYQTEVGYLDDMNFYAKAGFVVIKPDFRGQGFSKEHGIPEGSNYSMAYNTDVMSLITAIKKTSYLDDSKINLWGHSMGAHIALRASVLSPDIKTTILLAGPVSDFTKMYESYSPPSDIGNPTATDIRSKTLIKYGTPKTNPNFWRSASPINFVTNNSVYYQIHAGTEDVVVPPQFSADLDARLTSLSKDHSYYVYQGGDHDLYSYRTQIWQRSLDVLAR